MGTSQPPGIGGGAAGDRRAGTDDRRRVTRNGRRAADPFPACPSCGARLPRDAAACPTCAPPADARLIHRELVILACLCAIAVVAFFLTRAAAASERGWRLRDAETWYAIGERERSAGRHAAAIDALQRAAAIDPEDPRYQLPLASSLSAEGQHDAARRVLLRLRSAMPENPEVNLQLARLEARRHDLTAAVRYYQSALHGQWTGEDGSGRREMRLEVIRYLLDQNQQSRALSELLVLSANLPDERGLQLTLGELYLEADDPRRAADAFTRVLRTDPKDARARAGLGEAFFGLADYPKAQRELAAAPDGVPRVEELRALTNLILSHDPLIPRLPLAARQRRLQTGLAHAVGRLEACLSAPARPPGLDVPRVRDLQQEAALLQTEVNRIRALRDAPATIELVTGLTGRIEQALAPCGPPDPLGRALILIARRHGLD
jgi:tetratricopeptide (TPR) repeat protein